MEWKGCNTRQFILGGFARLCLNVSLTALKKFSSMIYKGTCPISDMWTKLRHSACSLHFIFCFRILLVPNVRKIYLFLLKFILILGATFLLKTFEILYLFNYHFQAVALAINLILWSGTMLQKKTTTFNCPLKGIELFWWWWTCFPIWRVSSLFNLQHVHRKQIQKLPVSNKNWVMCSFSVNI